MAEKELHQIIDESEALVWQGMREDGTTKVEEWWDNDCVSGAFAVDGLTGPEWKVIKIVTPGVIRTVDDQFELE